MPSLMFITILHDLEVEAPVLVVARPHTSAVDRSAPLDGHQVDDRWVQRTEIEADRQVPNDLTMVEEDPIV